LILLWFVSSFGSAFAQNPVPFVNQPLIPTAVAPGGPEFTLTVHGTGFVSGATVDWNGAPLTTTFVSSSERTASVPAANVATAGTASVTVVNPSASAVTTGITGNVVFFSVVATSSSVFYDNATGSPMNLGSVDAITRQRQRAQECSAFSDWSTS
jgi:hypothetical protein